MKIRCKAPLHLPVGADLRTAGTTLARTELRTILGITEGANSPPEILVAPRYFSLTLNLRVTKQQL